MLSKRIEFCVFLKFIVFTNSFIIYKNIISFKNYKYLAKRNVRYYSRLLIMIDKYMAYNIYYV